MPTTSLLGVKLWRVSRVLGCSPFDASLLGHTEAQLDFILLMEADEHPGTLVITKKGEEIRQPAARAWAAREKAWDAVLQGEALAVKNRDADLTALREGIERVKREAGVLGRGAGGLRARVWRGQVAGADSAPASPSAPSAV